MSWPLSRAAWRGLFWASVVAGFYLALRRAPDNVTYLPYEDKLKHAFLFAVLVLVGARAGYRLPWRLGLGLLMLGVSVEVAQSFTTWRSAEVADVVADGVGILLGTWLSPRLPGQPAEDGG